MCQPRLPRESFPDGLAAKQVPSVANSSDGLIFGKRRAKDGRFFLAKIRALDGQNSSFGIKKVRKFYSRHFDNKSA